VASVDASFLLKNSFQKLIAEKNSRKDNKNAVDNLIKCCNLVTHNGSNKHSSIELMKESLVAVFLTRCLQSRGYFQMEEKKNNIPTFTEKQIKVAIWIHHLMRVARFNSHEVTEYTNDTNETCEHGERDCCR